MRCPKCLSTNIERYKTVLWHCLDCGAIFSAPLPAAAQAPAELSAKSEPTPPAE